MGCQKRRAPPSERAYAQRHCPVGRVVVDHRPHRDQGGFDLGAERPNWAASKEGLAVAPLGKFHWDSKGGILKFEDPGPGNRPFRPRIRIPLVAL